MSQVFLLVIGVIGLVFSIFAFELWRFFDSALFPRWLFWVLVAGAPLVLIRIFIAWTGIFILIALVASIMSFEYWLFDRWFPDPWWFLMGLAAGRSPVAVERRGHGLHRFTGGGAQ